MTEEIQVERNPGGAGMVLSIHFTSVEAARLRDVADFHNQTLTQYAKAQIIKASWATQVKIT